MLEAPADSPPDSVVCFAAGHEAIACEMLGAIARPHSPAPIVVVRNSAPPAFVGPDSLAVVVVGPDGDPEAVTAAGRAADLGATVVAIAPAGLEALVLDSGDAAVELRIGTGARRSLGTVLATLLVTCESFGVLEGASSSIISAAARLVARRDALSAPDGGAAQTIARRIGRTFPVITGAEGVAAIAAKRWAAQIASSAKLPAFAGSEPDRSMIELAGFGQAGDITRQLLTLVELRTADEEDVTAARFRLAEEFISEAVASIVQVDGVGDDPLGQLLDLVILGDLVALHLAAREGIDPGPTPVVGEVARAVASSGAPPPTLAPGGP